MTNTDNKNTISDVEINLISWIFTNFKPLYKLYLNSYDLKYYKSLELKLKDIKKHTIEWEEFNYLLHFLEEFKEQLNKWLDEEQMNYYNNTVEKIKLLKK